MHGTRLPDGERNAPAPAAAADDFSRPSYPRAVRKMELARLEYFDWPDLADAE